jgi:hypothetical protein
MAPKTTMLELVQTVLEFAETEQELLATVVHMVNAGLVQLVGTFRHCTFVLDEDLTVGAA